MDIYPLLSDWHNVMNNAVSVQPETGKLELIMIFIHCTQQPQVQQPACNIQGSMHYINKHYNLISNSIRHVILRYVNSDETNIW